MYLLTNPMMLVLLITIGSGLYAVHALGMTPVVLPVFMAAYNQAHTTASNAIAGFLNHQQQQHTVARAEAASVARAKPKKE
jgi:hypothetical protein